MPPVTWRLRRHTLTTEEGTLVMGIVNVTPDSFSDGGPFHDAAAAVRHGRDLWSQGADIVDVGGESTRPGAIEVAADEEAGRIVPVIEQLAADDVVVSVDTAKAEVARAALAAGAEVVNDVTALGDPEMAAVVAEHGAGLVLMHMQGTPRTMQHEPRYDDVVAEVRQYLQRRAGHAEAAGIAPERIAVDPGIGFGKTVAHNLALLAHLDRLAELPYPVVVGSSRKSFLGTLTGISDAAGRDLPTAATLALAIDRGAAVLRVHDVAMALLTARVADAIVRVTG